MCHGGQLGVGWVDGLGQGVARHVARTLDGPFVVLLQEYGADQPPDGRFIGEDADDIGAPFDLVVQPLDGLVLCSLVRCASRMVM